MSGAILVLGVLVTIGIGDGFAQTRAAAVKDVDEPGRTPYLKTLRLGQTQCGCVNCCFINLDPVPAGKRLVIKKVSGHVGVSSGAFLGPITLDSVDATSSTTVATIPATFRTFWNGGNYSGYEFDADVLAYVDGGSYPNFAIYTGGSWDFRGGEVSISGYVVDLN